MKVAVVGAGISGLAAARTLADAGAFVVVFEKARGVGGRMSTRRQKPWAFDHGAQYFTARGEPFRRVVRAWVEAGVVREWAGRVVRLERGAAVDVPAERPRYVGVPGMSAVCRHLARGLEVSFETRVTDLDELKDFDARLLSVPAPQARVLAWELGGAIDDVRLEPCFAAMGVLRDALDVSFTGAFVDDSPLSWIALKDRAFVLHADAEWTADRFHEPTSWVCARLMRAFGEAVGCELVEPEFLRLHRWRYARATQPLGDPFVWDADHRLGLCGDWCLGARVEAAYSSGVALAQRVLREA